MKALLIGYVGDPMLMDVDGLEAMQKAVGGPIEPVNWLFDDEPAVYVNGDGKVDGTSLPNRALCANREGWGWDGPIGKGDLLDVAYGPMLCVGLDHETGESRDISLDEINRVMERFASTTAGSGLLAVACEREGHTYSEDLVGTHCYNEVDVWPDRQHALEFYTDCALNSEGSERDRYVNVILGLSSGVTIASDGASSRILGIRWR